MGKFNKPSKKVVIIGIGFAVVLITCTALLIVSNLPKKADTANATTPDFNSVLPINTSIDSLGGWTKRTPPNSEPFYVFTHSIDGVSVNVSQQAFPDSFTNNVDSKVSEIAKGYNATTILDANGTKIHIGNSAKGFQSVIFAKSNVLVLIVSEKKIQDSSWISYVNNLD